MKMPKRIDVFSVFISGSFDRRKKPSDFEEIAIESYNFNKTPTLFLIFIRNFIRSTNRYVVFHTLSLQSDSQPQDRLKAKQYLHYMYFVSIMRNVSCSAMLMRFSIDNSTHQTHMKAVRAAGHFIFFPVSTYLFKN